MPIISQHSSQPTVTIDTVQRYGRIMWDIMKTYFPALWSAPDSWYIMMATMELESGYRIFHGKANPSPNHVSIGTGSGIGRSYWFDPVIAPLKTTNDFNTQKNIVEGLSAKALMATMGMYQVRNCKESNDMLIGNYRSIAESHGLMVNPGQSSSAVFTNDDDGALKSIVMGCIVMETKYKGRRAKNTNDSTAMKLAVGDYLGKAGTKDILGSSPSMRLDNVLNGKTGIGRTLIAAGLNPPDASGNVTTKPGYYRPSAVSKGQTETKTIIAANTDNTAPGTKPCNRLT